jgi:hypothetical protein
MLYHEEFGAKARKVPAHMPHMINTATMTELQARYPARFEATSTHRFRDSHDMQFGFSYFYFVIHRGEKLWKVNATRVWEQELDVDGDGILSENELRTLASLVMGKAPLDDGLIGELDACMRGPSNTTTHQIQTPAGVEHVTVVAKPHISFENLLSCDKAMEGLEKNYRKPETHRMMDLDEVSFEMIGDIYNETRDHVRC